MYINMPLKYLIINALISTTKRNILDQGWDNSYQIQQRDGPTVSGGWDNLNIILLSLSRPISNVFGMGVAPSQRMSCPIFPKFKTMPCRLHGPFITIICWQSHCFNTHSSLFINNKQYFLRNMVKIAFEKKLLSMSSILKDGTTAVAPSAFAPVYRWHTYTVCN